MGERPCVRGCTIQNRHAVPHPAGHPCAGCLPVEALHGSYLCDRCQTRLRHTLTEAPDLCARIRSSIDPMKAQVYDREKLGGKPAMESGAPFSIDAMEAADEVLAILTYYAELFGDELEYRSHTFEAGADSVAAFHQAQLPAGFLVENLRWIVADSRVEGFCRVVLGPAPDREDWTIARALSRWPDHERDRYARTPCPECGHRTVWHRQPRFAGDRPQFWCIDEQCGWVPPETELTLWSDYFGVKWHEHTWSRLPEEKPGVVRCACGEVASEVAAMSEGVPA